MTSDDPLVLIALATIDNREHDDRDLLRVPRSARRGRRARRAAAIALLAYLDARHRAWSAR